MKKNMADNKISQKLFTSWIITGLLFVLSILFSIHLVHERLTITIITVIFIIISLMLMNVIIKHYWRTYWMLTILTPILMIGCSCLFLIAFSIVLPTKKCTIKSINTAECVSIEGFGNGVPELPTCAWKQMHIAGLILIGDEIEKECRSNG